MPESRDAGKTRKKITTTEIFDNGSEKIDFERYLGIARRRHIHFLIPLLLGWFAVWGSSWILKPSYKSSTTILVEEPTLQTNLVAAVQDDLQARLQSMQQQILSRTRLLMIIDKLHLYSDGKKQLSPDDKVATMRKAISVDVSKDAANGGVSSFTITYSAGNPHMAQAVTGELASLYISENQRSSILQSGATTEFLEGELEKASADLAEMDQRRKAFEATHMGTLPEQETSNLQILTGLQGQLQTEEDGLSNANSQKALHETEIQQFRLNPTQLPRNPDQNPNSVAAFDLQLAKLRDQLTDLRSRYTDSYPDVVKLKAQIAQTQREREAARAAEEAKGTSTATTDTMTLNQLQGQLQSDEVDIQNRQKAIASLNSRINEYESRINAEPASEQQLLDLNRGYDQSKAHYDDLLKKKQDSQMATSMEQMQQGERFIPLDQPNLPTKPDFPNRLKFCLAGLLFGLALGAGSVTAFELADDRLYNEADIKDLLPTAVICEIPEVVNPDDEQKFRRKAVLGWAMAATVLLIIVAGSAVSFIHG